MEIHALKLVTTEAEVNQLLTEHLPPEYSIENARVRLTPEGVHFQGEYPTVFVKVPFETLWELAAVEGRIHVRLVSLKVSGLPAGMFRGVLMDVLQDATAREAGVWLQEETLCIDVEEAARARKVPLRVKFKTLRCDAGTLLLEAGH